MSGTTEFPVPKLLGGVRVDRAVSMLGGVPRSVAASLVAAGRVWVDGVPVRTRSTLLEPGTVLAVDLPEPGPVMLEPEPAVVFAVVHQDQHVIVVDKPAGLVVHPGAGRPTGTLAAGLLARFPDLVEVGRVSDPRRPGLVHRLDRGTSGLLVVARTPEAYRQLTHQMAERTVRRRYLAVVAGRVEGERGEVDAPIGRSARTPTRMAIAAQGRPARTTFEVLARLELPGAGGTWPATLLALTLDTGRTHQIRVHLSAIGHPVVGDDRYLSPAVTGLWGGGRRVGGSLLPPGRLFLHAAELGFVHPGTGEPVRWTSALPPDLAGLAGPAGLPGRDAGGGQAAW